MPTRPFLRPEPGHASHASTFEVGGWGAFFLLLNLVLGKKTAGGKASKSAACEPAAMEVFVVTATESHGPGNYSSYVEEVFAATPTIIGVVSHPKRCSETA